MFIAFKPPLKHDSVKLEQFIYRITFTFVDLGYANVDGRQSADPDNDKLTLT